MQTSDQALYDGVRRGERRALAKAITLLESTRADHRLRADALLGALLPFTAKSLRLGITGVPGVGKSTFIEALGLFLIDAGNRVAVLAVDPSSSISGGSILGDKTRMERLSVRDAAYIRPSPASGTLGGVAEKTREAMLVCEAAGYDVIIVETVGVGQSEAAVASMTDIFVLMQLPNAGDDLQAIKKGVMELADQVLINKADLDPAAATRAQAQITSALRLFQFHGKATHGAEHSPRPVMLLSALTGEGVPAFWATIGELRAKREADGEFATRRREQALAWMWDIVHARLQAEFKENPAVREALPQTLRDVAAQRVAPSAAARALLDLYQPPIR
ncbi:MAG: methylmalonyl Co-A mutase-associated GTPase MeaB [Burkholderiaceae bacterium]